MQFHCVPCNAAPGELLRRSGASFYGALQLAETDKLTLPDYPISDEARAEVNAYRKAIRELNHQPGAPWDGGGELTPWPEMPAVSKVQEA